MKKRIRGWASALLCASLLSSGCHASAKQPGSIEGYDPGEEYLSLWVHVIEDTEEGKAYRESVNAFNDQYDGQYFADIEFIPRNDSGGGYSDKINASVMSGDLPDVITVDGPNVAAYAANGIIQPLAELTPEEREVYLPSILDQGTYDGKLYALGAMESSVGLYCNKDILAQAGVEIPDGDHPWSWSEFLEVLAKVKPVTDELGGYPIDMSFPAGEVTIYFYAPFFWSNQGDFVSPDGLEVEGYLDSEENIETLEFFKTLVDKGYMSRVAVPDLFESGRAAFKFDGAWEINNIYQNYPDINLGVAPYVVSDNWDGGRYTPTGSWAYAASSNSKNIEGATKLVEYMSGTESGKRLNKYTNSLPSTYEAFESTAIFSEDENYARLYEQLSKYGHPRSITPAYPQVSASVQQVLENVVISGHDAKEELGQAINRINKKLRRYERS